MRKIHIIGLIIFLAFIFYCSILDKCSSIGHYTFPEWSYHYFLLPLVLLCFILTFWCLVRRDKDEK